MNKVGFSTNYIEVSDEITTIDMDKFECYLKEDIQENYDLSDVIVDEIIRISWEDLSMTEDSLNIVIDSANTLAFCVNYNKQ